MQAAARRRLEGGFSFIEILVVMGIITLLTSMVVVVIPLIRERANQTKSKDNVKSLLLFMTDISMNKGGFPPYNGKNFTLAPIAYGMLDADAPGALEVLFSPSDEYLKLGKLDQARFKEVTKNNLKSNNSYTDMTSYAGRLNGNKECLLISSDQSAKATLCLCDDEEGPLHHSGGLVVGFSGGKADFWDWDQLEMKKPNVKEPEPFMDAAAQSDYLRCVSSGTGQAR